MNIINNIIKWVEEHPSEFLVGIIINIISSIVIAVYLFFIKKIQEKENVFKINLIEWKIAEECTKLVIRRNLSQDDIYHFFNVYKKDYNLYVKLNEKLFNSIKSKLLIKIKMTVGVNT